MLILRKQGVIKGIVTIIASYHAHQLKSLIKVGTRSNMA